MEHTHFVNCNGLDADGHLTTAYDIALMSRELITKHPEIEKYSMIWMENITHKTNKGTSELVCQTQINWYVIIHMPQGLRPDLQVKQNSVFLPRQEGWDGSDRGDHGGAGF